MHPLGDLWPICFESPAAYSHYFPTQIARSRSSKPRVVIDLNHPQGISVNSGIPKDTYLNEPFSLRLTGTGALQIIISEKGPGCHLFKKDLSHAYRKLHVDPR